VSLYFLSIQYIPVPLSLVETFNYKHSEIGLVSPALYGQDVRGIGRQRKKCTGSRMWKRQAFGGNRMASVKRNQVGF